MGVEDTVRRDISCARFQVLESVQYYDEDWDVDTEDTVYFGIRPEMWSNDGLQRIRLRLMVKFWGGAEDGENIELGRIITEAEFSLRDYDEFDRVDKRLVVPEGILIAALSCIVSGTRGIWVDKVAGTPLDGTIFPIIKTRKLARDMIPSDPEEETEKP